MDAGNHQIRPRLAASPGKSGMKPQVRAMGLVHNQRYPKFMYDTRNLFHLRDPPFIGGRHDQHSLNIPPPLQFLPHLPGSDRLTDIYLRQPFRIQIGEPQLAEIRGMIDRFMTISGYQQSASSGNRRTDCAEYTAGAPPHQIIGFPGSIGHSRILLQFPQIFLGLMKIVKTFYLCDIQPGQPLWHRPHAISFMTRHMAGINSRLTIIFQLLK